MKKIDYLIIVNTGSPASQPYPKDRLIQDHTRPVHLNGLGLKRPRIDDLIDLDGKLHTILAETHPNDVDLWGISQGPHGLTGLARYVAFVGGRTKDGEKPWDTRTGEQKEALAAYVSYYVLRYPALQVLGLDEVPALSGADMPGFSVQKWLKTLGLDRHALVTPSVS